MGLAIRIIPSLLYRGHTLVKGEKFGSWRSVGVLTQAVKIYEQRNVDELLLLDVSATQEGRAPDYDTISRLTSGCFMPMAVGGGVRTLADAKALLRAGADKVVMGVKAYRDPIEVNRIVESLGSQALVVSIDVKENRVWIDSGRIRTAVDPVRYAQLLAGMGVGEILVTSIEREGTLTGYDISLIRAVAHAVDVPVIAHGGCSGYADMHLAISAGASAVAAGALFQFTNATPAGAAEYLAEHGIEVRRPNPEEEHSS